MIDLNNNFQLDFELYNKKIRLILIKNSIEVACRKDFFKNYVQFIQSNEGQLFKGRIKLYKIGKTIKVHFKNEYVGTFESDLFLSKILNFKTTK